LPPSMQTALRLMYAGACLGFVLGVTFSLTTHSRTVHIGDPSSEAYKAGYLIGGVIFGLIAGGLWLWMAWANKRGRLWARISSTVLFGLLTLYSAGSLFAALPAAPKIVVILQWAAGLAAVILLWKRQSSEYYQPRT
jgi:hypothetical protein